MNINVNMLTPGVILETEGSVWKIQKRVLFYYKIIKKGTPNLTSPYDHSLSWQNARANTIRHAMVCNFYFPFSKTL